MFIYWIVIYAAVDGVIHPSNNWDQNRAKLYGCVVWMTLQANKPLNAKNASYEVPRGKKALMVNAAEQQ